VKYAEYMKKRSELLNEAEQFINEGKLKEYEAKEKEVKELDAKYEATAKAQANINALKEQKPAETVMNLLTEKDGVKVTTTDPVNAKDAKKVYLNAWAKNMMGMSLNDDEKVVFDKVNSSFKNETQTAATHAVLIPETVRDGIWREAGELFPILGDINMTFVPGDLTILKETNSGADADWYDEQTVVADSDFAVGELNLTGCELVKAIPISWKLRKMSIDAFISYIQTLLAEKMGAALAKAIVSGLGKPGASDTFKPQPRGIITAIDAEAGTPQIVTYDPDNDTTPDPLTYDKLAQAMGLIKSTYKTGASIYAKSSVIWGVLALLKDNQGRPLFIPDVTAGGVGRIFGLPVKEEDSIPDGDILIGNVARGYAMNVNENMTIYTEDHVKARYTDYMSYAIVDGDVLTTKAFVYIENISTV
jgi:HK97 family phage major capsid protein